MSWVLTALGALGLLAAKRTRWLGWAVGIALQPLWIVYALHLHQYGLIPGSVVYGAVNAANLRLALR